MHESFKISWLSHAMVSKNMPCHWTVIHMHILPPSAFLFNTTNLTVKRVPTCTCSFSKIIRFLYLFLIADYGLLHILTYNRKARILLLVDLQINLL